MKYKVDKVSKTELFYITCYKTFANKALIAYVAFVWCVAFFVFSGDLLLRIFSATSVIAIFIVLLLLKITYTVYKFDVDLHSGGYMELAQDKLILEGVQTRTELNYSLLTSAKEFYGFIQLGVKSSPTKLYLKITNQAERLEMVSGLQKNISSS